MEEPVRKIGPYKLLRKIGRGAFGVVWLAERQSAVVTTQVAVKLPRDEDIDLEAFKQEAIIWVQASGHPNVVSLIEADIYDEQVVIVSEYIPDGSLATWLKQHGGKAPSIESAAEIIKGVLAGLDHLHERRIIHRDLKPDNILMRRETPRLVDFGIARLLRTGSYSSNVSGTIAYMAPEAFDGKRNERTDIWAVGVIFYQLLAGRLPYDQQDTPAIIVAIMFNEPPPLPQAVPEIVRHIVTKALQRDPAQRYASVTEMVKDVREAERHLASRTQPNVVPTIPSPLPNIVPTIPGPPPVVPPIVPTPMPLVVEKKSHSLLKFVGATVVLALIVGILGVTWIVRHNVLNASPQTKPSPAQTFESPLDKPAATAQPIAQPSSQPSNRGAADVQTVMNSTGMHFVWVPAGTFVMGSQSDDEKPIHRVTLSGGFYLGRYEVTQAQWHVLMGTSPAHFKGDNLPVEQVSWNDAQEFLRKLNQMNDGWSYRLPTEAEWEYACRAGTSGDYAGDLDLTAWDTQNSQFATHPVGQKQPNAFGVYDMQGNVSEWCQDWYHNTYAGAPDDGTAWLIGANLKERVHRGGSYFTIFDGEYRSARRFKASPGDRTDNVGFRVVAVR